MGTDFTQERQQAHALLDMLPQEKLTAVVHLPQARMGRTPLDPHSKGAVLPAFRARV